MASECNSSLTYEPILMKLYTVAVYTWGCSWRRKIRFRTIGREIVSSVAGWYPYVIWRTVLVYFNFCISLSIFPMALHLLYISKWPWFTLIKQEPLFQTSTFLYSWHTHSLRDEKYLDILVVSTYNQSSSVTYKCDNIQQCLFIVIHFYFHIQVYLST